jgi:hypothetical protein
MRDQFGLVVMGLLVVILVIGLFVMQPRRRSDDESLNPHLDDSARDALEIGHGTHLVGNPPIDVVTRDGAGTAYPGHGAERPEDPEETDVRHLGDQT